MPLETQRPLKLALVSPYDHSYRGGVTDHINNLAHQFRSWGHHVKVIAPCSMPESVEDPDFIHMGRPVPIPSGGSIARVSLSIWLYPRIKALLEREAFDLIHLHEPFAGFTSLWTIKASETVNIGTFHTNGGHKVYYLGGKRLVRPYLRKIHGRIAVSRTACRFISDNFPGEYEIIPNGIQVDNFGPDVRPFDHLRDGKLNILFLGRLDKRKGLKYLLGAYSRLKWDWPETRLIIVGPGTPDMDSQHIIGERNLRDVVFVGGVSEEDKARYFRTADVYCSPATGKESFGIVLLEAMASGTPIVASRIDGYSDVIRDGHDGVLVPHKNEAALANAIERLLQDQELRGSLSHNGLKSVQDYRWERVAQRVMDHYVVHMEARGSVAVG